MSNQYAYRNHIKYLRNISSISLLVFALIGIGFSLLVGEIDLIFIPVLFLVEAAALWMAFGKLTRVRVTMGTDGITYTDHKGEVFIPYEAITKVKTSSVRYIGGWIKIISLKKTIRLTVVVKNIGHLLQDLKSELDQRGLNHIYNEEKLFKFLKTAAFSDESWGRMYRIWWKLILLTLFTTCIGIVVTAVLSLTGLKAILLYFAFPTIVYIVTEFIFKLRMGKLADKQNFTVPEPDVSFEKKVQQKGLLWGAVLFVATLVLMVIS